MKNGKETILVVGGAGYIGSHMCKLLVKSNYNVIILDNLSTGFEFAAKYGELIIGDIHDDILLNRIFTENNIHAVFHFAAFSQVAESVSNPLKYYKNNVAGTINLLESMVRHNVKKFIFSSTAAIFGIPQYIPIDENHPKNPISPYGKSKLMIEDILKDLESSCNFKSVSLRYFNAAGADSEREFGENHNPETHLIPIILQTANGNRTQTEVYGTDYQTSDGTCIRDYIHIEDLCDAHLKALNYIEKFSSSQFNLGNGSGFSIKEIIEISKEVTNKKIQIKYSDRRPGDPAELIADSVKAKKILNWEPQHGIVKIISDAWNWETK